MNVTLKTKNNFAALINLDHSNKVSRFDFLHMAILLKLFYPW